MNRDPWRVTRFPPPRVGRILARKTLRRGYAMADFRVLLALACTALLPTFALAQAYPARPVRMIIPFPPGGPTDLMGRMAADRLTRGLGVQVIADNRGGAGGNIGFEQCAKSPPDG